MTKEQRMRMRKKEQRMRKLERALTLIDEVVEDHAKRYDGDFITKKDILYVDKRFDKINDAMQEIAQVAT